MKRSLSGGVSLVSLITRHAVSVYYCTYQLCTSHLYLFFYMKQCLPSLSQPNKLTNYFSYWYRPLNPRKLTEVSYPGLRQNMNPQRARKYNRVPEVSLCCHLEAKTHQCQCSLTLAWLWSFLLTDQIGLEKEQNISRFWFESSGICGNRHFIHPPRW